jgi:aminoglycoside phosphotransferase (APT) family kinase protein
LTIAFKDENEALASSLAHLHTLDADWKMFTSIKPPKEDYEFARRLCSHFKKALYIKSNQNEHYKKSIAFAINWLEEHAENNCCPKYSLIHGDPNGGNLLFTNTSKPIFIDWECIDIGDPAYDLGIAYHMIKFHCDPKNPENYETVANQFISKYMQESKLDVQSRLKFYEVVGVLRCAITFNSVLSSPINAYRAQHDKVLLSIPPLRMPLFLFSFPFIRFPFFAQKIGLDRHIDWLNYFEKFVKRNCV